MSATDAVEPRELNGVTILGPDFFALDQEDRPLSPIASVFPEFLLVVTGRGIHAMQASAAVEFLCGRSRILQKRELSPLEVQRIYSSAVALVVWEDKVLIRSSPEDMHRVFAADEVLQRLLPKDRIQFTGIQHSEVRRQLRNRGESWRISPPPRSVWEISQFIQNSRVNVNSGVVYYQNPQSGGRFLTYEEFMRIRPLMEQNPLEAAARLREILNLSRMRNNRGVPEVSLFLPAEKSLPMESLYSVAAALGGEPSPENTARMLAAFDSFAQRFAAAAGDELLSDGPHQAAWRTTMFCRLYDISERAVEEWTLGLSPEFHLNIRWLPGVRIVAGEKSFEETADERVRNLIGYFLTTRPGLSSLNVGRVESPQTQRDRTGEEREVYLVVLGTPGQSEEIRLIRLMKWDVMHRLKLGAPLERAIADTVSYRDYIFDRLAGSAALGLPILSYSEVRFVEHIHGIGEIPIFFFDRAYVPGIVTDKIPLACYARPGFVNRLCFLLGRAAAASLVLGRRCVRTGHLFFDDGDEAIQLDSEGLPEKLIILETTGSFTDTTTPIAEMLPRCLQQLQNHLGKALAREVRRKAIKIAVQDFAGGLCREIDRMKALASSESSRLWSLFADRSAEPGSVRSRWENILHRLVATNVEEVEKMVLESRQLASLQE